MVGTLVTADCPLSATIDAGDLAYTQISATAVGLSLVNTVDFEATVGLS